MPAALIELSRTPEGRAGLAALIAAPAESLVALDFDGTLAPIVDDPSTSRLLPNGYDVLRALAESFGVLAIVTGRQAAEVVRIGRLDEIPDVVVEGQYGIEQWRDGELRSPEPDPEVSKLHSALRRLLTDADPGVWIEDKLLGLVVHTRRAADPVGELARVADDVIAAAESHGLEAHLGRNVVEIRTPGIDKGGAVRRLIAEFDPSAVLFGGDDIGDLPAFEAVEAARQNGRVGVTVCSASEEAPMVAERADIVVAGPAGMTEFLGALVEEET